MTEKEKSAKGLLYNSNDPELVKDRTRAKTLCQKYNNIDAADLKKRTALIKELVGTIGNNFYIEQPFYCDYGYNIEIGDNFYSNHNLIILDCAKVKFGSNVFIAPNCGFYAVGHPLDAETRNKSIEYAYPITIGDNVWIGGSTAVLPGVSIGDNTVIGAGSVVNKDIPANVIAAGNPCKVIRQLTEADKDKYK